MESFWSPKWVPHGSEKGRARTKRLQEGTKTLEKSNKERYAKTLVNNSKNGPLRVVWSSLGPPFGSLWARVEPKEAPKNSFKTRPNMGSKIRHKMGPKMGTKTPINTEPRGFQKGSIFRSLSWRAQESPKRGPREAQDGPRGRPDSPRGAQEEPKRSPGRPKRMPEEPKRAPSEFPESPRHLREARTAPKSSSKP